MKFTRDGWFWTVTMVLAAAVGLGGHFDLLQRAFPGISTAWEARIELVAFIGSIISAKLGFSPISASPNAITHDRT